MSDSLSQHMYQFAVTEAIYCDRKTALSPLSTTTRQLSPFASGISTNGQPFVVCVADGSVDVAGCIECAVCGGDIDTIHIADDGEDVCTDCCTRCNDADRKLSDDTGVAMCVYVDNPFLQPEPI